MDGNEEQSPCRSGGPGYGAVLCGKNAGDIVGGDLASAYLEECADEIANHVVQESRPTHSVDEEVS